jgi:type IV pilus assembly protein PilM
MLGRFGRKKAQGLVGLDIGSSAVKAVELRKTRAGYELVHAAMENLSPDVVVDGTVMDAPSVAAAIEKVMANSPFTTGDVAASVSGSSVMVKRIIVPAGSAAELAESIPNEAQQQLASDMSDVSLGYQVLGPAQAPNTLDVVLAAAKREKVLNYSSVITQAGRTPVVMDADVFALENAFEMNYEPPADQTCALLNVGASILNINIVRNGAPLFTRDIPFAGKLYTEALQKQLDLSFAEAERIKIGLEVPETAHEVRTAQIQAVSKNLLVEIRRTFEFFRQSTSTDRIDRVYLTGGTARIEGLEELLQSELKVPVEVLNPFRNVTVPKAFDATQISQMAPRMAVAVGLALRSFDRP